MDTALMIYIYVCVCVCLCVCVCVFVCVYLGSIFSLIHIWLNKVDILCLHIFVFILSSGRVDVMISDGNWLTFYNELAPYYFLPNQLIGLVGRVFANGPGDFGSITGCVIPKALKTVLNTSLQWYLIPPLSNIRYVLRVKWSNPRKGVAPSPTLRCSSYWKEPSGCPRQRSPTYFLPDLGPFLGRCILQKRCNVWMKIATK